MNTQVLQGVALQPNLMRIDRLLTKTQSLWQPPEFSSFGINAAYQRVIEHLDLADIVSELDLEQLDTIDADPGQLFDIFGGPLSAIAPDYEAVCNDLAPLLLPSTAPPKPAQINFPFWLETGIGGRKLAQIKHFIQATESLHGESLPNEPLHSNVLEWCAGKGHLGRLWLYYAAQQQGNAQTQVHSLEWQTQLCQQGAQLAQQLQLPQRFYPADAMQPILWLSMQYPDHALALHACGDLHRSLLEQGVQQGLASFTLAPCCYHLSADALYRPLSKQLRSTTALQLSKAALKLAVQGQVTGGQRIRTLRHQEVRWRLAYQCLREDLYEGPHVGYQPLPALPKAVLSEGFEGFLNWAFTQHSWRPEHTMDSLALLEQARVLQLKLRRVDVVRHNFRRLLELWLVLDRAVFLQEHEYEVEVMVFCPYPVSPRNLLIRARK